MGGGPTNKTTERGGAPRVATGSGAGHILGSTVLLALHLESVMRTLRAAVVFLLAVSVTGVAPRALHAQPAPDARIRAVMERPEFAHASWGMEFYDLDAKKVLASVNGDRLFVPGSTTKLMKCRSAPRPRSVPPRQTWRSRCRRPICGFDREQGRSRPTPVWS